MTKETKLAGNIDWEIGLGEFTDEPQTDMIYIVNTKGFQSFSMSMTLRDYKIFQQIIKESSKKLKELKK
jgi:hypothetical protein